MIRMTGGRWPKRTSHTRRLCKSKQQVFREVALRGVSVSFDLNHKVKGHVKS